MKILKTIVIPGIIILLLLITAYLFLPKKSIIIGFSAQLTGNQSELGVQERNGVILAFENVNKAGGINGRKIKIIIKDDLGTLEGAKNADKALINEGASVIIGHATSGQTTAGLEVTNTAGIIMISPTVSSPKLSGIDDFFFRVYPSFRDSSIAFARYVAVEEKVKQIAVIYDSDNEAYAGTYKDTFTNEYTKQGGNISSIINFSSHSKPDLEMIVDTVYEKKPDGILIVASDNDTALIAQRIRLNDRGSTLLFTSAWAQTETLINAGGRAVEGLKLEQSYIAESNEAKFLEFKNIYVERFNKQPSFGAAFAYEAAMVLTEALKRNNGNNAKLKENLILIKDFQGLNDKFSIDSFGDVERPFYLSTVKNGKYKVIKKLNLIKE